MTPHQTLVVVVRLFAVWLGLIVVREVAAWYITGRESNDPYLLPILVLIAVVAVLCVLVLWFFPRTVARGLLPSGADAPVESSSPEVWFAIGISLLGLWLAASAIPGVLRNFLVMYFFRAESVDKSGLVSGLIYLFAQLVVGVALIVGTNGIRKFIWWARDAGRD
jgi:hypothetical protein